MFIRFCLLNCIFLICAQIGFADEGYVSIKASFSPNHQVEILLQKSQSDTQKVLVFLHGAKEQGLASISREYFDFWHEKGYSIAAISMPGYGLSTGERDFCGSFTLDSLNLALDRVKKEVNASEVAIMGFGQGALAAVLLSTEREDLRCVVSCNGAYDLNRHCDFLSKVIERDGYNFDLQREGELIVRSPICHIRKISTAILLLHRRGNPIVNEQEVVDFYDAMIGHEKECEIVLKDRAPGDDEQKFSIDEILLASETWIDDHMQ
ncbi:MAG: alpha/beta hydrolase [Simkaniaceae bacterium]|nr:alpha/beta hydrolase [Candidatus Sacchlamyda saccharinae]